MPETLKEPQTKLRKLITPAELFHQLPANSAGMATIQLARQMAANIMRGADSRLLVVIGPCSIHDYAAAIDYAQRLKASTIQWQEDLLIVMRVYFEKPRTKFGWKGLIRDPFLNSTFDINFGLALARKLLIKLNELNIPCATEFLDTLTPQYLSDLITWCAVGARTSESQTHRELASSLPMPVGFKNTTDGNVQIAIDAVQAAADTQHFLTITPKGEPAIMDTRGNPQGHIVLRGARDSTNYAATDIQYAAEILQKANLSPHVMIDCNHGNSGKNYWQQNQIIKELAADIASGNKQIGGVMIESNLVAGNQKLSDKPLTYGQSITDGCIGWTDTVLALEILAQAVRLRKQR